MNNVIFSECFCFLRPVKLCNRNCVCWVPTCHTYWTIIKQSIVSLYFFSVRLIYNVNKCDLINVREMAPIELLLFQRGTTKNMKITKAEENMKTNRILFYLWTAPALSQRTQCAWLRQMRALNHVAIVLLFRFFSVKFHKHATYTDDLCKATNMKWMRNGGNAFIRGLPLHSLMIRKIGFVSTSPSRLRAKKRRIFPFVFLSRAKMIR